MAGRIGMRWGVRSRATCHPDRLDMGGGLCKRCYQKTRYISDGGKTKAQMLAYARSHHEQRRGIWRRHAHGISEEEWRILLERSGGRCEICRRPPPVERTLDID